MIILDTNVVSEPTKSGADIRVVGWLDKQVAETLFLSAVSLAELLTGVAILPLGKRRITLTARLNLLLDLYFGPRILSFDEQAAVYYSSLVAHARSRGYTVGVLDAQIAAIARVHGFTIATRDEAPFRAMDVPFVNPWTQ